MSYIAKIAGLPCRESNRIGIDKTFVSIKDVIRGIKVQMVALGTDRHLAWPSPHNEATQARFLKRLEANVDLRKPSDNRRRRYFFMLADRLEILRICKPKSIIRNSVNRLS